MCAEASSQYSGANNLRLNALFIKFAVDNLAITGSGDMRVTQYPQLRHLGPLAGSFVVCYAKTEANTALKSLV